MSFFKPYCFALLCAVMLMPACAKKSETPVTSPAATTAVACDGAVFQEKCVHKGDIVTFGKYPQATETPEPIEWLVLDIDTSKGQMLLLSKYVLDAKPYNTEDVSITWENSTLRTWLNDTFKTTAFTSSEQQQIALTHLENPDNPTYGTNGGNATDDKVFLLTIADAFNQTDDVEGSGRYFSSDAERQADATRYAVQNGVGVIGSQSREITNDGTCTDAHCFAFWWLRSPGRDANNAALVFDFAIVVGGGNVSDSSVGVRPALWVKY